MFLNPNCKSQYTVFLHLSFLEFDLIHVFVIFIQFIWLIPKFGDNFLFHK